MKANWLSEEVVRSDELFSGKVVRLLRKTVKLPNSRLTTREVVEHRGAVALVVMPDEKSLILVRQFRLPAGRVLLELPAGTLNEGETPEACARRELAEETGYEANNFEKLLECFLAPGYSSEVMHIFRAEGLRRHSGRLDEDEAIEVVKVGFDEALQMIERKEIEDAKSICGILATALRGKEMGRR